MFQSLNGKTLFITGASRGIGLAIARKAAQDGANIVIVSKTTEADPRLQGTIYTAQKEIESIGGAAVAVQCDIRDEKQINAAIIKAESVFGGIDIVVNNASAIDLRPIDTLDIKRFDLMHDVNVRGTYLTTKFCLPHLRKSSNPHVLTLSPPLSLDSKWWSPTLGYSLAKMGMSLVTMSLAEELRKDGIAVNSLWPETTIATAAVANLLGGDKLIKLSRTPEIVADAAYCILTRNSKTCTGNFFIDVNVLTEAGITDFAEYSVEPNSNLALDWYLDNPISSNVIKLEFPSIK